MFSPDLDITVFTYPLRHQFMIPSIIMALVASVVVYITLKLLLYATQSGTEPSVISVKVPFLQSAIEMAKDKTDYFVNLRKKYNLPIYTLRMPFQRIYVVTAPRLIQAVQSKTNASTFVPTLLDFGMLFSGLNKKSKKILTTAYGAHGNGFTQSVHKYLSSGLDLQAATRTAVDKLSASVPNNLASPYQVGLLEVLRHQLTLAVTGAIYGPENPYDDPAIEKSWLDFVPGISHLLYSPFPWITALKALKARARVIKAFERYFETGGHTQAFAMIPEMFKINTGHGLNLAEAAKLEMATSLAMLSSGAITLFWFLFHVVSDSTILQECRQEVLNLASSKISTPTGIAKVIDLSDLKQKCPTLMAVWHETLRYHSTVINIKKVQHDTTLSEQYHLKKDSILMIPGTAIHHDTETWGPSASTFNHTRFFTAEGRKKLSNTSAFRPFGAGVTMCPGRHFATNAVLSLAAMILLQYDVEPVEGQWKTPSTKNADMWNAMPKPDCDIPVRITRRSEDASKTEWKFVWGTPCTA